MTKLSRQLGLFALTLYGIGDILGAGIYALVGKVANVSGEGAWLSFLISALLAAVTGFTYAELSSRVPKSAGAAAYSGHAFRHPFVPFFVGVLVLASGVTSASAVSLAMSGYLSVFVDIPPLVVAVLFIGLVSFISFWGIRESVGLNNVMTLIEFSGLVLVIVVGVLFALKQDPSDLVNRVTPQVGFGPILAGATLAFFAFIGFEDMTNLAEEAKNPSRDIPRAILIAVSVSTVIYIMVIFVVLWAMTPQEAGASEKPLLDVLTRAKFSFPSWGFAMIALIAICNTGLANLVMASRLLYGMSDQGILPPVLAKVHPGRHTPWVAVLVAMVISLILVLTGGVTQLAKTTAFLLIIVFTLLHVSLIVIRRREPSPEGIFRVPSFIPYAGIAISFIMATQVSIGAFLRAGIVSAVAALLYWGVFRKKSGSKSTF